MRKKKGMAGEMPPKVRIPRELLEQLVTGSMTPEALDSMFRDFKKAFLERALNAELDVHLEADVGGGNPRNGSSAKTVLTDEGAVRLDVPRDRGYVPCTQNI
nr:transposase [Lysobacter lactosilyticus]